MYTQKLMFLLFLASFSLQKLDLLPITLREPQGERWVILKKLSIHFKPKVSPVIGIWLLGIFTPLESPSIYAEDGRNRNHQLLIGGGVKAPPFLTGFVHSFFPPFTFIS